MKYISIDIESTGLDIEQHDIIEFAAVIDDLKNPQPLDQLPVFHSYIKKRIYSGDPSALAMHAEIFRRIAENDQDKYNIEDINNLMVYFRNWLSRNNYPFSVKKGEYSVNVAGKNAANFDIPFLKKKITDWSGVSFHHRILDVGSLYFRPEIDLEIPSSKICMERAGLSGDVAHTAEEDAMMVVKLIRKAYSIG